MPAGGVISRTTGVDATATTLVPYFNGRTGPHWACEYIRMSTGSTPSMAQCVIPLKTLDTIAPGVAAVDGSPISGIRGGTELIVRGINGSGKGKILFSGLVTDISQRWSPSEDQAVIIAHDWRWWLARAPVVGSFWVNLDVDGDLAGDFEYRSGWHWHVNPNGEPNLIWQSDKPLMCPPRYGLGDDEQPAKASEKHQDKAALWTNESLLEYVRFILTDEAEDQAQANNEHAWYQTLHTNIVWPAGLGNSLAAVDDRVAEERDWNGVSVLEVMDTAIRSSGPLALYATPNNAKSTLSIIKTRYDATESTDLNRPNEGDADSTLENTLVAYKGEIAENIHNTHTRVVTAGGLIFIERRVMYHTESDGLLKCWTQDEEDEYEAYITARMEDEDELLDVAVRAANRAFPAVGAAYRLNPTYDFTADTSEEGKNLSALYRPILGNLLSSYKYSGQNFRRPILFEYQPFSADPDTGVWYSAMYNDGLLIDADGTIWLQGLREAGITLLIRTIDDGAAASVAARKLRVTIAIPCDHRLHYGEKISVDSSDLPLNEAASGDESRMEFFLDTLLYQEVSGNRDQVGDRPGVISKEIRVDSYPIPQSSGGTVAADLDGIGATASLRDDTLKLEDHVSKRIKDFGRVDKTGYIFIRDILAPLEPGKMVRNLKNTSGDDYPLSGVITAVVLDARSKDGTGGEDPGQHMMIELR